MLLAIFFIIGTAIFRGSLNYIIINAILSIGLISGIYMSNSLLLIISCYGKKAKFEVSGGVNLKNIVKYSKVGANYISTSKITLCSKSVDISLDLI